MALFLDCCASTLSLLGCPQQKSETTSQQVYECDTSAQGTFRSHMLRRDGDVLGLIELAAVRMVPSSKLLNFQRTTLQAKNTHETHLASDSPDVGHTDTNPSQISIARSRFMVRYRRRGHEIRSRSCANVSKKACLESKLHGNFVRSFDASFAKYIHRNLRHISAAQLCQLPRKLSRTSLNNSPRTASGVAKRLIRQADLRQEDGTAPALGSEAKITLSENETLVSSFMSAAPFWHKQSIALVPRKMPRQTILSRTNT